MLFHSQAFVLLFLPAVLALYYGVADRVGAREWVLIAASLVFYGWWDARFIPLLLAQVIVTWLLAEAYFRTRWRGLLHLGIVANLASLGFFKYASFLTDIVRDATGLALAKSDIVLPIGISFFTFQLISYLVDAMRGTAPRYSARRLALFVMLFPHLIAGPIVRHNEIIPQFDHDPRRDGLAERLSRGIALFVVAFAIKVFLADRLALHVDPVFVKAATGVPAMAEAWAAAFGFALQIYLDFSAYSEMAMGLALMLGLRFPQNFNRPYRATDLRDFWRRWHMSLSRFLRDYVYIPLGGSRSGTARLVWATMATMGLCGLWHGAGWTFVIWGLLHGLGLVAVRGWQAVMPPLPAGLAWGLTVLFVVAAFVVFRAPDLATAASMLEGAIAGRASGQVAPAFLALLAIAGLIALLPRPSFELVEMLLRPDARLAAALAAVAVVAILEVGKGQPTSFIYFQF
jgi:D-alanyl-lipoteichoic acid acyltransferase DltB (MBOAT superfamily)